MSADVAVDPVAESGSRRLLVFPLGPEEYGVPIKPVHEIVRDTDPRPTSGSWPHVEGAIDLATLFGDEVRGL